MPVRTPQDRYQALCELAAQLGLDPAPLSVKLIDNDPAEAVTRLFAYSAITQIPRIIGESQGAEEALELISHSALKLIVTPAMPIAMQVGRGLEKAPNDPVAALEGCVEVARTGARWWTESPLGVCEAPAVLMEVAWMPMWIRSRYAPPFREDQYVHAVVMLAWAATWAACADAQSGRFVAMFGRDEVVWGCAQEPAELAEVLVRAFAAGVPMRVRDRAFAEHLPGRAEEFRVSFDDLRFPERDDRAVEDAARKLAGMSLPEVIGDGAVLLEEGPAYLAVAAPVVTLSGAEVVPFLARDELGTMVGYAYTVRSGDEVWLEPSWPVDCAEPLLRLTAPGREYVDAARDAYGPVTEPPRLQAALMLGVAELA